MSEKHARIIGVRKYIPWNTKKNKNFRYIYIYIVFLAIKYTIRNKDIYKPAPSW